MWTGLQAVVMILAILVGSGVGPGLAQEPPKSGVLPGL